MLALLTSVLFLLTATGAAAAGPPDDRGKPDRGRDAYVAIGDSFASGVGTGLPDLDLGCYRSSAAYPPIVDVERFDTSLEFVACGGATTATVTATQLHPLDRQTDFVTLSVGGNDIGFGSLVAACVGGATDEVCLGAVAVAEGAIAGVLPARLDATYDAVRERVRRAEVIVVGYPRFFSEPYVPCLQSSGISATEAAALNGVADQLDAVIANRAASAGFTYVSVVESFTGHDMCAAEPWVNGLTFVPGLGQVVPGTTPSDSYHPNRAGYREGFTPLVSDAMEERRPSVSQVRVPEHTARHGIPA
nr:SGNH/GDSL hydrolase family protein [Ornithinimicrobium sediminis]